MSYFDSPKNRRIILDKLRAQLAEADDSSLLDGLSFADWGEAFDKLNTYHECEQGWYECENRS